MLDVEDMPPSKSNNVKNVQGAPDSNGQSTFIEFFTINYWQKYFDFSEFEIIERLSNAFHPQKMSISGSIKTKPDLYVPFWMASLLVFCLFAFGNLSGASISNHYNFDYIGKAVSLVYMYLIFAPLIIYFVCKIQNSSISFISVFLKVNCAVRLQYCFLHSSLCYFCYSILLHSVDSLQHRIWNFRKIPFEKHDSVC